MVETRWSWVRQLYWGIVLFIIFFAANMFFFDETLLFKTLLNLFIALLSLWIAFFALKTFKVTPIRLKTNQFNKIYLLLFAFCLLLFMLASPLASLKAMLHSKYLPLALLSTFTGSLFEEAICRGLILSAFLGWSYYNSFKHSFLISAILSSTLFALMYLTNFFSDTPSLTVKEQDNMPVSFLDLAIRVYVLIMERTLDPRNMIITQNIPPVLRCTLGIDYKSPHSCSLIFTFFHKKTS